jgi:LysM repeat protein
MSSQTARTTTKRAPHKTELEEPYPPILEPKQSHFGNVLAILSVMAVLAFGLWAAFSTLTSDEKPGAKASATAAPTSAAAQATTAPTAAPTALATSPTTTPTQATTTTASTGEKIHVVGAGDTLYGIARRYGTTVEAIMAANGFTDRSKILHVGDKLVIP